MAEGEERVNEELKRIENSGTRRLTAEERAVLEAYADSTGMPKTAFQVYDDTDSFDQYDKGTVEVGPQHPSTEVAVAWAEEQEFAAFSVYQEVRVCTKAREIWYAKERLMYSAN